MSRPLLSSNDNTIYLFCLCFYVENFIVFTCTSSIVYLVTLQFRCTVILLINNFFFVICIEVSEIWLILAMIGEWNNYFYLQIGRRIHRIMSSSVDSLRFCQRTPCSVSIKSIISKTAFKIFKNHFQNSIQGIHKSSELDKVEQKYRQCPANPFNSNLHRNFAHLPNLSRFLIQNHDILRNEAK